MGGSIFAVIAIWGLMTHTSVPLNIAYASLAVTFTWAAFLAWRKEALEGARLQAALNAPHSAPQSLGYERPGRIFIDEKPAFLQQFFRDHTSVQAQKLLDPYLGKWFRPLSLTVQDINKYRSGYSVYGKTTEDNVGIHMKFDERWSERISILRRGSVLSVIGQIVEADQLSLSLQECEILTSSSPTPPGTQN